MGQAFGAISNDLNCIHSNPAGLAHLNYPEILLHYNEGLVDTRSTFIGIALPNRSEKINIVGALSLFHLYHGEIVGRAVSGYKSSNFTASDKALTVSYGLTLTNNFSIGANLKFIQQEIAKLTATAIAFDIGTLYQSPIRALKFGLCLQNIGSSIKFIKEESPLPTKTVLSAAYKPLDTILIIASDLNLPVYGNPFVNLGLEYNFGKIFSARLGLNSECTLTNPRLSYGFGMEIGNYALDYAFLPFGNLGDTHRISLNIKFGK